MASSMRHSFERVETSGDMYHVLGQDRSSTQQQYLNAANEKTPLQRREKGSSSQDKHRVRHYASQSYLHKNCELRRNASAVKVAQSKSSEDDRKPQLGDRACDDNELVKNMSNLPGFLLKVETENTVQEKALNFGVLDWKRLEKWKYTERMPGKLPKKTSGGNSSFSAREPTKIGPNLRKQPSSHGRNPSLSYLGKQPTQHRSHFSPPKRRSLPSNSSHLNSSKEERSSSYQKEENYVEYMKSKGKETCNQEYQAAESIKIGRQHNHFQQSVKLYDGRSFGTNVYKSKRQDQEKEMMSSSKKGKNKISLLSRNKINAQGTKSEMRYDEVKLTSECCPADPQENVLEVPKNSHEKSCSESPHFTESRTSLDAQLYAMTENRLSDFFSPQELYSGEYSSDIPLSCPLPCSTEEPHNLLTSQIDVEICPSADPVTLLLSEAKCSEMKEETARASILTEVFNQKQADIAEQPTVKGISPSLTRRFSFNLGRMSRSLSFKESSAVPQLSSTYTAIKSGQVRPEVGHGMDNSEKDQTNVCSRGRSSPLRRLLDPLLKHRTAAETVRPPNGTSHSLAVSTTVTKGPSQDMKLEGSAVQALLQLTFKNGLPFFKLVIKNSKDMLAAAVKRLPTSGKSDHCMIYSFYSVHQFRKKSTDWIYHGSKSKSCNVGYNIFGQMKISNSYNMKVKTGDTSECDALECILYGVDPTQVDKQMLEFVPNKEIAAIVIKKTPVKSLVRESSLIRTDFIEGREFPHVSVGTFEKEGSKTSNGTVVILPGGIHGMPINAAPSSLISRWRSGGSCDCGGWDVGCKLRILADSGECSNILQDPISSSIDCVNLYVQGGRQKSKPVFSLKPFSNEFYSIELDASISLLEAFATSVAHVTCWKFPEIIGLKGQSEAVHSPKTKIGTDQGKTHNTFQRQLPAKYVTCPPLSPVGRI